MKGKYFLIISLVMIFLVGCTEKTISVEHEGVNKNMSERLFKRITDDSQDTVKLVISPSDKVEMEFMYQNTAYKIYVFHTTGIISFKKGENIQQYELTKSDLDELRTTLKAKEK